MQLIIVIVTCQAQYKLLCIIQALSIVPNAPFTPRSTSKLRSALHFRYSIAILRFIPSANTAEF